MTARWGENRFMDEVSAAARRGHGKPLVLPHCLGMNHRFWDVLEPLADRFELIAYSFPGHGDTPLPAGQYGAPELTAQLHMLAQREGLRNACHGGCGSRGEAHHRRDADHAGSNERLAFKDAAAAPTSLVLRRSSRCRRRATPRFANALPSASSNSPASLAETWAADLTCHAVVFACCHMTVSAASLS